MLGSDAVLQKLRCWGVGKIVCDSLTLEASQSYAGFRCCPAETSVQGSWEFIMRGYLYPKQSSNLTLKMPITSVADNKFKVCKNAF